MNPKITFLFLSVIFISGCINNSEIGLADTIINKSIEVSGGDKFKNSIIDFDFRDRHYKAIRDNGLFQYEREFQDSLGVIKDVLSNSGYERFLNNEPFAPHDTMAVKYARSVNSVHYFSVLPFGLNDDAVNKTYLDSVMIKGKKYHKLKVDFNETGGGEDYEDVFIYYINSETHKVDYFSYIYFVDGGGIRFREAYNERYVNGLRFVDYKNYKSKNKNVDLYTLDSLFQLNELKLLSKVDLENITVK
ncbi:MAG: deoxyribose-phosphate aldolase [Flavobacteriaceae bacterium]